MALLCVRWGLAHTFVLGRRCKRITTFFPRSSKHLSVHSSAFDLGVGYPLKILMDGALVYTRLVRLIVIESYRHDELCKRHLDWLDRHRENMCIGALTIESFRVKTFTASDSSSIPLKLCRYNPGDANPIAKAW